MMIVPALLLLDGAAPTSAVVPGRDGRIAFTRADQIYTIHGDGTGLRQLTDPEGGVNSWPKWGPYGRRIAYINEPSPGVRDLWIMNADGSEKTQVTTTGDIHDGPAWSPDGHWLAFIKGNPWDGRLYRVRTTAPFGTPTPIWGASDPNFEVVYGTPSWSASSNWMAILVGDAEGPRYDMYLFNPATKEKRHLGSTGSDDFRGGIWNPAFSADGTLLRYSMVNFCDRPSIRTIRVQDQVHIDEGFTSEPLDDQIAFAPSGTRVALVNDPYGTPKIYIAKFDGSPRRQLTEGYQPDWQRLP